MTETRKVIVNGTEYIVEVEGEGTTWKATVEGQTFDIEMPDAAPSAKPRRAGGRKKKKSGTVSANIPGKVVTVEVKEGERVEEGQVILILEAMKMQHELTAPMDGSVVEIFAKKTAQISVDDHLIEIQPNKRNH